jgi:hypothetical protein
MHFDTLDFRFGHGDGDETHSWWSKIWGEWRMDAAANVALCSSVLGGTAQANRERSRFSWSISRWRASLDHTARAPEGAVK